MRSTFKLSLAALTVALVLTGCKSTQGPSVVAKSAEQQAVQITESSAKKAEENSTVTETPKRTSGKPNKTAKVEKPLQPETASPSPQIESSTEVTVSSNDTETAHEGDKGTDLEAMSEDGKGKAWRVISLSRNGELVNTSESRKDNAQYYIDDETSSPLGNSDEFGENEYNHFLTFELGQNEQNSPFVKTLNQKGENYLGQHSGTYRDPKIVGDSDKIHYLYVNQPYSSYGALFTDPSNSKLFHVQLSTGRDGNRASSEEEGGKGSNYAEYGVYTLNGKSGKWNTGLVGDATYHGNVIARFEKQIDGENVASQPQLDGNVTLNLHLDNKWENSTLSGVVNSKTVGTIQLDESKLAPAIYMVDRIGFSGSAENEDNPDLVGDYSVDLIGPNLDDAVGSIELENEADEIQDNTVTKYNAVFGAIKTTK